MGKSLIQTVNQSVQSLTENSMIGLGAVQRRYGCDLKMAGNGIEVTGTGYFTISACVSVAPTEAGNVTVAAYNNGIQIPGAIAYGSVSTAESPVTLPIIATIRRGCNCSNIDNVTIMLVTGAGNVQNVSLRIEKS